MNPNPPIGGPSNKSETPADPNKPALTSFSNVTLRPPGERYGEADLLPGGSLGTGGGMLLNERNFRETFDPQGRPQGDVVDGYARYDPMFPGETRPGLGGGPPMRPQRGVFPGEPDNDLFLPPQGGPRQPFGGPGGGQFGPCGNQGPFGGPSW
ncbi:hypothetical protein ADEAN_000026200 [Angomonas deanei]|uniref:Uncharacterized protein n=1 Tax=Angomonas deanei TaxID=59799 RepID=A0A7G2BZG6_9TRYP|nr:hypothetical protein ADEAN_000026200 [Angomonas deanei]